MVIICYPQLYTLHCHMLVYNDENKIWTSNKLIQALQMYWTCWRYELGTQKSLCILMGISGRCQVQRSRSTKRSSIPCRSTPSIIYSVDFPALSQYKGCLQWDSWLNCLLMELMIFEIYPLLEVLVSSRYLIFPN